MSQSRMSIHLSFSLTCLLGTHNTLKVTSPILTSTSFPWVSGRKGLIVSQARKLEMLHVLHFFFFLNLAHSNNEDDSVQKSNQVFWHELCCSDPQNLRSHHCQVEQILIRSSPRLIASCMMPDLAPHPG